MDIATACVLCVVWLSTAYVADRRNNMTVFVGAFLATLALQKIPLF
jgi:hypothetical protein